jgi:hypothetical protein
LAGTEDGKQAMLLEIRLLVPLFLMDGQIRRAVILGIEIGRLMVERAKYEHYTQVEGDVDAFANRVEERSEFHDRRQQGLILSAVRIGGILS